jgi:thiopurine S-methyltransferase
LQPEFWQERWRAGQTGFHQSAVEPNLLNHWMGLNLPPESRVYVPLCGKSLDLIWLAQQAHRVIGVELSAVAVEGFYLENGVRARRRSTATFDEFEHKAIRILQGDIFAICAKDIGTFAAVYDRAALISWAPELRQRYANHMTALSLPGTITLLLALEYPQQQAAGPPFSVTAEDIYTLYGAHHEIEALSRADVLAQEPRFRARGLTELTQACYLLRRL